MSVKYICKKMETKVMKSKPLSKEENKCLLELIETSKIITTKATNATSNKMKDEEWNRIAEQFNATATNCRRSPHQLRLKWENMKKNARKRNTKIRMNNLQTGGGVGEYIPPDEILDRVTSLLGSTASGFVVSYGGDKEEPEASIIGDGGFVDGLEEIGGDARVNFEILDCPDTPISDPVVVVPSPKAIPEPAKIPDTPQRVTLNMHKTGKRKLQADGCKSARDLAVAEYYKLKKQCMETKLNNIVLQNEKLNLENEKLRLEIEVLKK